MLYYRTIAKAGRFAPIIAAESKAQAQALLTAFVNRMRAQCNTVCSIMLSDSMPLQYAPDDGQDYANIETDARAQAQHKTSAYVTKAQAQQTAINAGAWINTISA